MADVTITTAAELLAFSQGTYGRGASGSPLSVELANDIDMADLAQNDIAYNWPGCTGTWYCDFDGKGHKIDNIYYMDTAAWGFFNSLYGSVQNLKLTNIYVTSTSDVAAGIAVLAYGSLIKNCQVSGHIEALNNSDSTPANGIYFRMDGTTVRECSVSGIVKGRASANGLGQNTYGSSKVYNCTVHADIIGETTNVSTFTSQGAVLSNCIYVGKIYAGSNLYVGCYSATLNNCILVFKAGSSTNFRYNSTFINCYYDSTVATAAGFSLTYPTGATTTELQSNQWLQEHGFAVSEGSS